MNNPVGFFAALPAAGTGDKDKQRGAEATELRREGLAKPAREVLVTGAAELSCPADRASLRVSASSTKESVNEASNSISRRLEYVLQTLRQHGVKDEHTTVRRCLHRDSDNFTMDVEILVTFSEFEKMEQVCGVLLEKLDKTVHVGAPEFFHSPACLSELRLRSCVTATENAQQKASKICQLLGESLGAPLLVREEETREWRHEEEAAGGVHGSAAPPVLPRIPTATASSQVSVSFSFRDISKKKL